jgi:hypothetical protein
MIEMPKNRVARSTLPQPNSSAEHPTSYGTNQFFSQATLGVAPYSAENNGKFVVKRNIERENLEPPL